MSTQSEEREQTIANIRQHFRAMGWPLDELTDDEVEGGIRQLMLIFRDGAMSVRHDRWAAQHGIGGACST